MMSSTPRFLISFRTQSQYFALSFPTIHMPNTSLRPFSLIRYNSDRGFQYTSQAFYSRLKKHHMKQSMSRAAPCIDNGPMERFWGILKWEMYYGKCFTSKEELIQSIQDYIEYYNNRRLQSKLHISKRTIVRTINCLATHQSGIFYKLLSTFLWQLI